MRMIWFSLQIQKKDLQAMLNAMYKWGKKGRLNINPNKSNIVHFRSKKICRTNFKFLYCTHELLIVDKYKYLGVIFDALLTMQTCIEMMSDFSSCGLGVLLLSLTFKKM